MEDGTTVGKAAAIYNGSLAMASHGPRQFKMSSDWARRWGQYWLLLHILTGTYRRAQCRGHLVTAIPCLIDDEVPTDCT